MPILLPKPRDVATKASKEAAASISFTKQTVTKKGKLIEAARILDALRKLNDIPQQDNKVKNTKNNLNKSLDKILEQIKTQTEVKDEAYIKYTGLESSLTGVANNFTKLEENLFEIERKSTKRDNTISQNIKNAEAAKWMLNVVKAFIADSNKKTCEKLYEITTKDYDYTLELLSTTLFHPKSVFFPNKSGIGFFQHLQLVKADSFVKSFFDQDGAKVDLTMKPNDFMLCLLYMTVLIKQNHSVVKDQPLPLEFYQPIEAMLDQLSPQELILICGQVLAMGGSSINYALKYLEKASDIVDRIDNSTKEFKDFLKLQLIYNKTLAYFSLGQYDEALKVANELDIKELQYDEKSDFSSIYSDVLYMQSCIFDVKAKAESKTDSIEPGSHEYYALARQYRAESVHYSKEQSAIRKVNVFLASEEGWTDLFTNPWCQLAPNARDQDGNSPLHKAATGSLEAFEVILNASKEVDIKNKLGQTPLMLAVHYRNYWIVEKLLANGADPECCDLLNLSSLAKAAIDCDSEMLHILSKYSKNFVNLAPDLVGYVIEMIVKGHEKDGFDVLEWLYDKYRVDSTDPIYYTNYQQSAEYIFEQCGFLDQYKLLLKNIQDTEKYESLMSEETVAGNDVENDELVVDKINSKFDEWKYKLHTAIESGSLEQVEKLLSDGWKVDQKNDNFDTPLTLAVYYSDKKDPTYYKIVELLLKHGADPQAEGAVNNAIVEAAVNCDLEMLKILKEYSADFIKHYPDLIWNAISKSVYNEDVWAIIEWLYRYVKNADPSGQYDNLSAEEVVMRHCGSAYMHKFQELVETVKSEKVNQYEVHMTDQDEVFATGTTEYNSEMDHYQT